MLQKQSMLLRMKYYDNSMPLRGNTQKYIYITTKQELK